MKKIATLFAVTLFAGMTMLAAAQEPNQNPNQDQDKNTQNKSKGSYESKSTNTTTTDTESMKNMTDTVYGKVEEYEPGKSIKISTPGKSEGTRTYDLSASDTKAHVASNVKVGEWVSVKEKTDNSGKKMLTISRSKHAGRQAQGTGSSGSTGSTSSTPKQQ
jgi:hypothetical protein